MVEFHVFRRHACGAARSFPGWAQTMAGSQGVGKIVPGDGRTRLDVQGAAECLFGLRGMIQGVFTGAGYALNR